MDRVEDGRARWISDRPSHEAFAQRLQERVVFAMKQAGVVCNVTARAKAIDSLVKKLIKKPDHTYDSLPDKVGARLVVRYRSEIEDVVSLLSSTFSVGKIESKTDVLDDDQMGYLSHHIDRCCFRDGDPDVSRFPPHVYFAELQVRTKAQHLWAEMTHDLVYKGPARTHDLDRRVNLMAAQIEVADREFDRLGRDLAETPEGRATTLLERYYYKLTSRRPDNELTHTILGKLLPELHLDPTYFAQDGVLDRFLENEFQGLAVAYDQYQLLPDSGLFHQPEALLLYERMTVDALGLQRAWNIYFPPKELDRLAVSFGISFE
jgi:ppGpp synthetase/RelA/SpoT-type nucleotidyltranferase